ncbi:ATP-binding protein [Acinetobacter sp. ANC5681]|jgi:predicted ATPase|uniref:ATP-binding protein n=1 Tax=Acinetobacter sp. ANC5681 TaxID=2929504 RepID=UPI00201AED99|nr:ATP-binding protein [Acinetobacter sp. ANC5681]MCL5767855.1 ATP-binding protein [Acinetobacter sp. ANC5681]
MPIIYQLEQNKNILKFIDNDFELQTTNIFTFLVGKNSVGKSRLLRSLIIHALEEDKFDKVLALSNTQYHKFPSYRDLPNKEQISNNKYTRLAFEARTPIYSGGYDYRKKINNFSKKNYHYLFNFFEENNIKFHKNLNTNLNFTQSFESFLTQFSFKEKPYYNLLTILDFLKLDHYVKCTILPINSFKIEDLNIKINNHFTNSRNISSEEYEIFRCLKDSLYDLKSLRSFDLLHLSSYELKSISFLIESGLVRIYKISFSKDKKTFNYTDLSSGELAVLSLVLGLTATITDNSLVCIDEPEINLHPQWQEKIIELIELVSENYYGCHFFIATHSPQLISGISEKNSFILDLTNNTLKTIESFKNRSSDFQLSEVFNFPGKNNEYLIRKLILLLNKLNNEEDFILDTESNNFLKHINQLLKEEKIDQEDKVRILFNLVNSYRG